MDNFILSKKISLVDIVISAAKEMGDSVSLTCLTFKMPKPASVKLQRAQQKKILSEITVYMEAQHRRKKSWVAAMLKCGWHIYNVPVHAKIAMLEKENQRRVFISSNNWQAGGCLDFFYEIPDRHIIDEVFSLSAQVLSQFTSLQEKASDAGPASEAVQLKQVPTINRQEPAI